jgi:hypothetical protein
MSFSRAMAGPGGGYDFQVMNFASTLFVIPSRADGEGPRKHIVTVRVSKEGSIAGVRSLSVLRRLGMTAALISG